MKGVPPTAIRKAAMGWVMVMPTSGSVRPASAGARTKARPIDPIRPIIAHSDVSMPSALRWRDFHSEKQRVTRPPAARDRKSVVWGQSESVRVDRGGRRLIQKTTHKRNYSATKQSIQLPLSLQTHA